jgi:hypothetical protein
MGLFGAGTVDRSAGSRVIAIVSAAALIIGAFVVATTLYGVHHFYSPIVWWDEWDGYIGFYLATLHKNALHAWLQPHVEHRIVTSRVLYWLDIRYFQGYHLVMFAAEQASLAGIVALIAQAYRSGRTNAGVLAWVVGVGAALMFSWVQSEILKWGFETCVVLAYLCAACAVFTYTRERIRPVPRFVIAFVFSALSEYSMGNGIGAPLTIAALSIVMRRPMREIVASACVAVLLVASYSIGYVKPPAGVGGVAPTVQLIAQFFIVFLGNPLYFIGAPLFACGEAGLIVFAASCWIGVRAYIERRITPYRAFLLGVIIFVLASAAAATIGRYPGGVMAAIESRYTTGPLLCWLAIALLAFDINSSVAARAWVMVASVAASAMLALSQSGVDADNAYLFDWKLGVLSQKIGLDHIKYSGLLFPVDSHARFIINANRAAAANLAIYNQPWLRDAGRVKFDPARINNGLCNGAIDIVTHDDQGATVSGWAVAHASKDLLIVLTDQDGNTVGYGVTGGERPDVARFTPDAPSASGWVGFSSKRGPLNAFVYSNGDFCPLHSDPATNR